MSLPVATPTPTPTSATATGRLAFLAARPFVIALPLIALLTLCVGLLAWKVSAAETVAVGTDADGIYITDGFYDPEQSAENGTYRWTQPLGQLSLPDWGPGTIHITISGMGVVTSEASLKISGMLVAQAGVQPGKPWSVQAWGVSASRNPTVTIEAPLFTAPGDKRTLGLLVQTIQIYAPDVRVRAFIDIALLGLTGMFLFLFLQLRTSIFAIALIAGLSIPALLGPFAAYRDPWMDTVAWVAPLALAVLLVLQLRLNPMAQKNSAFPIPHPALIVLALSSALLLLYLGYMNAFDSDRMYQVSAGIAEYGRPTRYPGFSTWTKYGFGQPLLATPFYFLGKLGTLVGGAFGPITRLTVSFTNLPVAALTCWLLYKASRRFASVTISLAVAATYLLATPALNYARTFFSEPAGALLLLAALLLIIPRSVAEPLQPRRVLVAGLCLGAMILLKPAFAIYIPAPGIAVIWLALSRRQAPKGNGRRLAGVGRLAPIVVFTIGPIVGLLMQAGYNYIRYAPLANALFRTGYEKEPGFSTPLLVGLGGLLFSPGKSIFLFAPVLLLAPIGLWFIFRRRESSGKLTVALILTEVAVGLVFNSLWWAWTGNFAWGPRLIIPILPLLVWPLAALPLETTGDRRPATVTNYELQSTNDQLRTAHRPLPTTHYLILGAWVLLGFVGALVSIPGALVDFQVYFHAYGLYLAGDPGESVTLYDPANSPLLVEPGYLLNGLTAAFHRPSLASTGMPPISDALAPAALVLLSLTCLWHGTRENVKRKT